MHGSILGILEALTYEMFGPKLFGLSVKQICKSNLWESIIHAPIWSSNFYRSLSSNQDGKQVQLTRRHFAICSILSNNLLLKMCLICHRLVTCQPLLFLLSGFVRQVDAFVHCTKVWVKFIRGRSFHYFCHLLSM